MSVVFGWRPIATSSCSARTGPPESSSTVTSPSSARTAVALVPSSTSTPFSRSDCSTSSLANGSSRGISRSPRSISVTSEPSELYACAISTPTTPPPRIASRSGISFAVVASRLVHGFASRRPSIGGISGALPVATTTARRATSVSSPTRTRALAVEAAGAAHHRHAALLEPRHHVRVVEPVDDLVAALQHGVHVEVAGHRLAHARDAAHLGEQLAGAQHRLRRHARVERALAADQVRLDDRHLQPLLAEAAGAHLARRSGAQNHHVEFALAHAVTVLCLHGHRRRAPQA